MADFGLNEHYGDTAQKNWYRPVGEEKSHRTDIYALGIIFKQMLTGSTPDCPAEDLPNAIVPLITKMTEPDPAERYGRFSEVSADLKNLDENGEQVFIELDLGEQEVLPPSFSFGRWLLGVTAICIASLLSYAFYSFDVDWTDLTSRAEHDAQEARLEDDGWRDLSE